MKKTYRAPKATTCTLDMEYICTGSIAQLDNRLQNDITIHDDSNMLGRTHNSIWDDDEE